MKRTLSVAAVTLALLAAACQTPAPPPPVAAPVAVHSSAASDTARIALANAQLSSTLWQQTSVEYRALTKQAYTNARLLLDAALADPKWTAALEQEGDYSKLPPAIILDIDETVIDTSAYQASLMAAGVPHTEERFEAFVAAARSPGLDGAKEFLDYAVSKGVKVFYLTNRRAPAEQITRNNLAFAGLPVDPNVDTVILRGERPEWDPGDKAPRRRSIAENYRVLLVFGDDFNDFVTAYGKTVDERAAIYQQYRDYFGMKWIILPNANYGTWDRALVLGHSNLTPEEELRIRKSHLRSTQ
jgi:5'-nucleotidase (lipoprotein e(P4) family)